MGEEGIRVGQQLGNYRLERLIGRGGFAEVYLGYHVRLNRQAAIKVLRATLSEQEKDGFQREAQVIAALDHPHIVRILDFDVQQGVPFLVMDYLPNGTLRQRHARGERLPLTTVVSYVKQVAEALQYAHEQRLIHRDIKPENMLVGRRQEVVLSDFGIATIAHSTSSMTAQGPSGTIPYMAPEQIQAHARPASDQYALGIVTYEWLCGGRPFDGSYTEVFAKHLMTPPPPLRQKNPALPPTVEEVVLTALHKDPSQRFGSVLAFATALEQAVAPAAQPARPVTPAQPLPAFPAQSLPPTKPVQQPPPAEAFLPFPTPQLPVITNISTPENQPLLGRHQTDPSLPRPVSPRLQTPPPPLQPRPARRVMTQPALLLPIVLSLLLVLGFVLHGAATGTWPWSTSTIGTTSTSTVATTWTARSSGTSEQLLGVAWSGSLFVVVGSGGTIPTSPDGTTWTAHSPGTSQFLDGVAWSGSVFVAVGLGGTILTSPNGTTWTAQSSGTSQSLWGVAWSGSQSLFVTVGGNGTILTSPDGASWTTQSSGISQDLLGVAWSGSQSLFVAAGDYGTILTSPNGATWTAQSSGTSQILYGVAWSGFLFVAIGYGGTILTSSNGATWTTQSSGTLQHLYGVAWSGSLFVAVGGNGTILTSPGGASWTEHSSGISQNLYGVAWSGSVFVAVGANGTILTSP